MAERRDPHYEETNDPRNPPQAVLNRGVRRTALWTYLGPIVVLFIVIGIALLYWLGRGPGGGTDRNNPAIGTTGQPASEPRNLEQGGGDPAPRPGTTQEELENRGGRDAR